MSLDDFFKNAEEEWKRLKQLEADAAKRAAEEERRRRIEELKARREGKGAAPKPPAPASPAVTSVADYIKLENIECRDAEGNVFERYGELYVKKEVEKDSAGQILTFKPYGAIHRFEPESFLPSSALMANIHVTVYRAAVERQPSGSYLVKNAELELMLQKLKDRGDGTGGHYVNTVINWGKKKLIHYPTDADFPSEGGTAGVNTSRQRKVFDFDKAGFEDMKLEDALKIPNFKRYLQNYSGLAEPAVLLEVAAYYQKTARVWVSSSQEVRAAWFGCGLDLFGLDCVDFLYGTFAARGVRLSQPQSGAQLRGSS